MCVCAPLRRAAQTHVGIYTQASGSSANSECFTISALYERDAARRKRKTMQSISPGRMVVSLFALVILACGSTPASDNSDVLEVVHAWANSFNTGDSKAGDRSCADETTVIDDFPPHVWQGRGACSHWYKDFLALATKTNITNATIVLGKERHLDFDSGYAYLVAPVTLSFNRNNKPVKETGILTMILHKDDSGWRITGWSWADD